MKDLAVGDKVMTASGQYKTMFTFSHSHASQPTIFLQVHTNLEDENAMELTPSHMLFLEGKPYPVPAKDVKVGDFVQTLHGPQQVTNIGVVARNGFYNPLTTDGTIVVDGILSSTYTSLNGGSFLEIAGTKLVSAQNLFEMTIAPYRAFCTSGLPLGLCNPRDGHHDEEMPFLIKSARRFYEFWLRQNASVQFICFLAYVSLFGVVSLTLSSSVLCILAALLASYMLLFKPTMPGRMKIDSQRGKIGMSA